MRWKIIVGLLAAAACWTATVAAEAATRAAAPTLAARPRAAPRGGRIVLHGKGFAPMARVVLLAGLPGGERMQIGRAKTDGSGRFVAPIAIRRDVRPGRYVAYACRHRCRVMASVGVRVLPG